MIKIILRCWRGVLSVLPFFFKGTPKEEKKEVHIDIEVKPEVYVVFHKKYRVKKPQKRVTICKKI